MNGAIRKFPTDTNRSIAILKTSHVDASRL